VCTIGPRPETAFFGGDSKTPKIHGTGIFTYIYYEIQLNSGKYAILGSYGLQDGPQLVIKVDYGGSLQPYKWIAGVITIITPLK